MKHLTLIRHAKSSRGNASLGDFQRPLNDRGQQDAQRMGAHLKAVDLPPVDRMVASPALRARMTAETIGEALRVSAPALVWVEAIYAASVQTLGELVQELDASDRHVLLVGHNPGFEQLTSILYPDFQGDGEKFPTCGVAHLELAVDTWQEVREGCATSCEFIYPKMI